MSRFPLAATTVLVLSLPVVAVAQTPAASPVVVTRGVATVKRAPDRAWLTIATETRDVRADDARQKSAQATTEVQTTLKATGLAADAIRTTGYVLTPEMEWNNGRGTVKGYVVRNEVEVRVDDLSRLGRVIDAANATKNTTLTIVGPRFALKDQQAAEAEALRLAVEAAVVRAQAMASGAKRALGAVVRIDDQGPPNTNQPQPMARLAMARSAEAVETPITPGDIEIRAEVSVTFELR